MIFFYIGLAASLLAVPVYMALGIFAAACTTLGISLMMHIVWRWFYHTNQNLIAAQKILVELWNKRKQSENSCH